MPRADPLALLLALAGLAPAADPQPGTTLDLHLRRRVETAPGSGRYHALTSPARWDAKKTAVVICDMWDRHWCPESTARVAQLAPRMYQVVQAARTKGALIIHCPSDTLAFYKDHPGRNLAQAAPKVEPKVPLQRWCGLDKSREAPLPIDDSDGGCESPVKGAPPWPWTRQIATIQIEPGDAITDSAEAYYLMRQRGIDHVLVMGVHTNMCVLGRPFSIRQLVSQGLNVALVRDMTDTMYNPAMPPFVSHFTGTDMVVEHIEKYWCPTVTSADLLGGQEFRFPDDKRPHLVILAAEDEYKTEVSLPQFARTHLGQDFRVSFVFADAKERHTLPGLDVLKDADLMLVSVRRRALPAAQMALLRQYVAAGKPVVGIRTASHAFALRPGEKLPDGCEVWPAFDQEVLGCHYTGHHPAALQPDVTPSPGAASHPILAGVKLPFRSEQSLYKSRPLTTGAQSLLTGKADTVPEEPVAWVFTRKYGGRTFATSLGGPEDFASDSFTRLLKNGLLWAAGRPTAPARASRD